MIITQTPDFAAAEAYARQRLRHDLKPVYVYHSLAHTEREVVAGARRLAAFESVTGHDLLLLETAAWFHDLGFVEQQRDHEYGSVRIARQCLPALGYSASDLDAIDDLIMATRLPQSPKNLAGQILADADLDIFGRDTFLARNAKLRLELAAQGKSFTDHEWFSTQLAFLEAHRYFTASAQRLNADQKAHNIAALKSKLMTAMMNQPNPRTE